MDPERWRRIDAVLSATLERTEEEQASLLARACEGDEELRREVQRSLAVLPLENFSGDPGQEYLSDGMTEAPTADLSQIGALRVVSRTSVMQYKQSRKALKEIARALNVDLVVEGSVVRAGSRVRVTAQLIDAATERAFEWLEKAYEEHSTLMGYLPALDWFSSNRWHRALGDMAAANAVIFARQGLITKTLYRMLVEPKGWRSNVYNAHRFPTYRT